MSINIRFPNITATTNEGKLQQMQSYMHQLTEQLNWALNALETAQSGGAVPVVVTQRSGDMTPQEAADTFQAIKALIIKSADIVSAYEETIRTSFDGKYVAESVFGKFVEETNKSVEENSKGVKEVYTNVQTIETDLVDLKDDVKTTNAYINRGLLYYDDNGNAVYGIEVGETSSGGAFRKYARFTSDRLSFFGVSDEEIAYIGAGCLYVNGKAVFLGEIQLGGYKTDTSDGLAFTWIGG